MRFTLFGVFLLVAAPALAQQDPGTHIGVGVRVSSLLSDLSSAVPFQGSGFAPGTSLLVPINLNNRLRIEPEIGFGRSSEDNGEFESTVSQYVLGLGVMALMPRGDFSLYAGGRVRYASLSQETTFGDFEEDEQSSSIGIAPVVGGEYFFAQWFSLGGEAGLEYRTYNSEEDGEEGEADFSSLATLGAVYVRFYFN